MYKYKLKEIEVGDTDIRKGVKTTVSDVDPETGAITYDVENVADFSTTYKDIGDPSTANLFVNGLQDERDFYRRCGAEGLGRMGDPAYVTEVARKYLRESSKSVKLAMGFAIFRMGRDEHLVEMIDNVLKEQVFHYFLELSPQDIKKLYSHIESEKPEIRVALLEIVGLRGDQSALTIVERMAKHPNLDISASASLAARRLHGP